MYKVKNIGKKLKRQDSRKNASSENEIISQISAFIFDMKLLRELSRDLFHCTICGSVKKKSVRSTITHNYNFPAISVTLKMRLRHYLMIFPRKFAISSLLYPPTQYTFQDSSHTCYCNCHAIGGLGIDRFSANCNTYGKNDIFVRAISKM